MNLNQQCNNLIVVALILSITQHFLYTGMSSEGSEFGYATETKTAQTEQLSKAEVEEIKRIVIK